MQAVVKYERGRFRAEKILVRRLDGFYIVFWDKETIGVYLSGSGNGVLFHRWFELCSYKRWDSFRTQLIRKKNLSHAKCFELALKYDVQIFTSRGHPELDIDKIEIIDK